MNENKILDLSMCADEEAKIIKGAFDLYIKNVEHKRYFGYVDKTDLPKMCKMFDYTDKKAFAKGCIFGAGIAAIGYIGVTVCKKVKSKEEKEN